MKKLILFLLIGALLILSFSGCFASNDQNEGTTPNNKAESTTPDATKPESTTPEVTIPEVTTPEVTTPEVTTPEVTTPEVTTPEVTTPEVTTPENTTLADDPAITPEQNLVVELFGDETVEFEAVLFAMASGFSSDWPLPITVKNGGIYIYDELYSVSQVKDVNLVYQEIDHLSWGVEKDEKALDTYEKIKKTTSFYCLETDSEDPFLYEKIELCVIDGVYYFIAHTSESNNVLKIYYSIFE